MTEPSDRWTLRVRSGEIDLPLILLIHGTSLRAMIHNNDEITTPELFNPKGESVAKGSAAIEAYVELIRQPEDALPS
jgi:hypothetical protein